MEKALKILIITAFFPPENSIGGYRPYYWAQDWAEAGHEVDVLTIDKNEERLAETSKYNIHYIKPNSLYYLIRDFYRKKIKKSSTTSFVASPKGNKKILGLLKNYLIKRGLGSSNRMPDPHDLWINPAFNWAIRNNKKWDVVISTFGPYACHMIARKIKFKNIASFWVADFRDTWVDSPYFKGIPPFILYEKYLEKCISFESDMMSIVSEPLKDLMKNKYPYQDVVCIRNGFNPKELETLSKESFFQEQELPNFNICYTGTLYAGKSDPLPLFQAVSRLKKEKNINLHKLKIYFAGPFSAPLVELVREYNLQEEVIILGMLTREQSLRLQRDSDILLFLETSDPATPGILTGKLFEYIYSGRKIWALGVSPECESSKVILKTKTGLIFGNDVEKIKTELEKSLAGKSMQLLADKEALKLFTRKASSEKLMKEIQMRKDSLRFISSNEY